MSHFSNKAFNSTIAFHMLLGNGPICNSAQYCSMQTSFVSIFSTVSISSSVSVDDVEGSVSAGVGMVTVISVERWTVK